MGVKTRRRRRQAVEEQRVARVFISHSSSDKDFAGRVAETMRDRAINPWIDRGKILVGDDLLERLGEGLRTMDFLKFIVSREALESPWVDRELKFAASREIAEKQTLILSFIIDSTPSDQLPWFLRHSFSKRVSADDLGVRAICDSVSERVRRREGAGFRSLQPRHAQREDPHIGRVIAAVGIGDWRRATAAALEILRETDPTGGNPRFDTLLEYVDLPDDDDRLWSALHTVEMCAQLAPHLMRRATLYKLATHPNFSVRSAAASICMRWAQFTPECVPVDILVRLSSYNEDYYVERPANAALKSMITVCCINNAID
jgi:TIR domain